MSTSHQQNPDTSVEILLVEDNPGDIRLVREAFEATDRETTIQVLTTGDDAVECLARQAADGTLPDLVLLDLKLPGRDGRAVLEAIRSRPRLQCLPVVVLTNSDAEEDVERCYDAHANAYISKPTDPAEFSSLIESVERFWIGQVQLPPVPA